MSSPHGCFIVPPYVLEALALHRSERVSESAKRSLLVSERLRARRPLEMRIAELSRAGRAVEHGEQRRVFTCRHTTHVPGMIVRVEGDPVAPDPVVDEAYDAAGTTYEFYRDVFGRDSIDDRGMHLVSSVHYSREFDNAFWNGRQMVYGDGDGEVFGRFTSCLDVIGHELTHGVVQYGVDLAYDGQSGALNESVADVFGSLVKQWHRKQTAHAADWLIGAGLLTPAVNAQALRSMKAPGTAYDDPALGGRDPQPAHMRAYVETAADEGGVHINSGIPNHAFYLVATALGGHAWETAGHIWYETVTASRLRTDASFGDFAAATIAKAAHHGARIETVVREAWHAVGVVATS
ncbi:MAG: M4 family metallopeptidase [Vulcanimicrobiaceae bacterium]